MKVVGKGTYQLKHLSGTNISATWDASHLKFLLWLIMLLHLLIMYTFLPWSFIPNG